MKIKAAVTYEKGLDFEIREIGIQSPKQGEVLVRMVASGICHTDLNARNQHRPVPLPAVLGHEGAGIVEEVGPGVNSVQAGDHVVFSQSSCGFCKKCRAGKPFACEKAFQLNFLGAMPDGSHRLYQEEQPLSHFFGQSSFASYSVASERSVVKVSKELPLEMLGPLGCGIQTGSGTIFNRLKPSIGSTIAVFGCGTVGLSAIMAAKVTGASRIIGVDVHDNRLVLARELGATHTLNSRDQDIVAAIRDLTGSGVDYAIDTSAHPDVFRQAVDCTAQSGTAVIIGGPPLGTQVTLDMNHLLYERSIIGVLQGNSVPQTFIPQLIELYQSGIFPFDKLLKYYPFEEINQAVHDMEKGKTIKPVILMENGC
ncbi:alcohol dehydrogenase [Bacillus sp. M6-12]|uniref:NAD(P)-dependent alcohol dehydrogenase n=1 Tax=Bacillus sp. M6-12 TaxID=2054166 RepID=UPI000C783560|nr:NAD(P)-dependent alcohol dehydrogenase [Bacillus sp. M6-12]PLS17051.1 alcohol dehydrogenase [Bacillus sp. M6-12]